MDMRLVDAPSMHPFTCIDGSQGGPIVDTLITHRAYGRMYWPARLVVDAARLIGMVPRDDLDDALGREKDLAAKVAVLEGEIAELQPVRDALDRAAGRYGDQDFEAIERRRDET